jgi:hypothetical protein
MPQTMYPSIQNIPQPCAKYMCQYIQNMPQAYAKHPQDMPQACFIASRYNNQNHVYRHTSDPVTTFLHHHTLFQPGTSIPFALPQPRYLRFANRSSVH